MSYHCHNPLGILKCREFLDFWSWHSGVRKKSSSWRFFVGLVLKSFIQETQRNSFYQIYAVLNVYNIFVMFHMMIEHNHDFCGGVTELHGCCEC